jgi:hypothetical protein
LEATGQFFRDQLAAEQSVIRTENRYRAGSYKWLSWNLVIFAAEGVTYGFARNFISNAIKYQNPEAETSYVQFDIVVDANQARITITDNGIGVEEQFVPHLFDMFFRATETAEGSGLGLYISEAGRAAHWGLHCRYQPTRHRHGVRDHAVQTIAGRHGGNCVATAYKRRGIRIRGKSVGSAGQTARPER